MKATLKKIIGTIDKLVSEERFYYSAENKSFYAELFKAKDEFGLYEIPSAWSGIIVECKTLTTLEKKIIKGKLNNIHLNVTHSHCDLIDVAKITSVELYEQVHDTTLMSALCFASKHHQHQTRKSSGEPYINHIIEVLQILSYFEPDSDESTKIAAALHDIVEDTPVRIESVEFLFGLKVAAIVSELTCESSNSVDKKATLLKKIQVGSDNAKIIKLADVISNSTSIPQDWTLERKKNYAEWCRKVAVECSTASPRLYEQFYKILLGVG